MTNPTPKQLLHQTETPKPNLFQLLSSKAPGKLPSHMLLEVFAPTGNLSVAAKEAGSTGSDP